MIFAGSKIHTGFGDRVKHFANDDIGDRHKNQGEFYW